jgi:ammonium transporter, Amt family
VNICNGLLAGLVSVTASCNNIENYSAFVIGLIGGVVYIIATKILEKFKIDDPCCASQMHAFCGMWGCIAVGFFDKDRGVIYTGRFNFLGI